MEDLKTKFIYYRESAVQSIVADITSLGFYLGILIINRLWLGDSRMVTATMCISLFIWGYARASSEGKIFTNLGELKDFVNKLT